MTSSARTRKRLYPARERISRRSACDVIRMGSTDLMRERFDYGSHGAEP